MLMLRRPSSTLRRSGPSQVTAEWVLKGLIEIHDRAMQHHAVLDREGKPIGEYVYQGQVASRALELLGKHLGMFDKQRGRVRRRPHRRRADAGVKAQDWAVSPSRAR